MKFQICILWIVFLSQSIMCYSNTSERDSIISISGQILDLKSREPIPLASISITRSKKGTICDSTGIFHLQVLPTDTLVISALGFQRIAWKIPTIIHPEIPPFFHISLRNISYLLDEVDIYALGTWEEFKEDFVKMKLKVKNQINQDIIKQLAPFNKKKPNIVPANYRPKCEGKLGIIDAIFRPTDFMFSKLSKSEKSKKQVARLIRNERNTKKITAKYNAKIIAEATGLRGNELLDFMEYCGLNIKVKANSSDYEVMRQILHWFEKFKHESTVKE